MKQSDEDTSEDGADEGRPGDDGSSLKRRQALERLFARVRRIAPLVWLLLIAALLAISLHSLDLRAFRESIASVPPGRLALVAAVSVFAVSGMWLYDVLLCRWLAIRIPQRRLFRYSWVANTFNNMVSAGGTTGPGIRYVFLTREGVSGQTAGIYAGLQLLSLPLGVAALAAWVLAAHGRDLAMLPLPVWIARLLLLLVSLYLPTFWFLTGHSALHRRIYPGLPPLTGRYRLALILISLIDWLLAALTLWICLWAIGASIAPEVYLSAFAIASGLSLFSFLPGGLGVFDGLLLLLLGSTATPSAILGGLVLYRLGYYLLPLLIGAHLGISLLTIDEGGFLMRLARRTRRHPLFGALRLSVDMLASLGVNLLGYLSFSAGLALLLSAAFPALSTHMRVLKQHVPLFAVESSYLLSVAIGVLLIGASRGIAARMRSAYVLTEILLIAGAVLSLVKGFGYAESTFLLVVAWLLVGARGRFSRAGYPLLSKRNAVWLAMACLAILATALVGTSFHADVDLASRLFSFGYRLDAARFARMLIIMPITLLGFLAWTWFRMPRPAPTLPDAEALRAARAFYDEHGGTGSSFLTFTGDKYLYYNGARTALIQYGTIRNRLVAMGDPACTPPVMASAIADFRQFAERYNHTPIFYQVDEAHLHHYHDCGFSLLKLGEKARVPLEAFSLSGKRNEDLRSAINRGQRLGLRLEILQHPLPEPLWTRLREISDEWLATKPGGEKTFSVGRFDRAYLQWMPIVVVRQQEEVVAFANLVSSFGSHEEIGIDLMRHADAAPSGTMDFLFVRLMQESRAQGYRWFDLGMAPLSGVGGQAWARHNERLIRMIYEYGDAFYHYKGLRHYKEKFNPHWRSLYLAYPSGRAVQPLLIDLAVLVAGGYRHLLS